MKVPIFEEPKDTRIKCKGFGPPFSEEARYLKTIHELSVEQRVWYYKVTR